MLKELGLTGENRFLDTDPNVIISTAIEVDDNDVDDDAEGEDAEGNDDDDVIEVDDCLAGWCDDGVRVSQCLEDERMGGGSGDEDVGPRHEEMTVTVHVKSTPCNVEGFLKRGDEHVAIEEAFCHVILVVSVRGVVMKRLGEQGRSQLIRVSPELSRWKLRVRMKACRQGVMNIPPSRRRF